MCRCILKKALSSFNKNPVQLLADFHLRCLYGGIGNFVKLCSQDYHALCSIAIGKMVMILEGFDLWQSRSGIADSTIQARNALARYLPEVFTKQSIEEFLYLKKSEGRATGTLNLYVNLVRTICGFLNLPWGSEIKYFYSKRIEKDTLSEEEIRQFLEIPPSHYKFKDNYIAFNMFWRIIAGCGLRCGEAAKLKVDDIDFTTKQIKLHQTKTKPRVVPIPDYLFSQFSKYLWDKKGLCFITRNGEIERTRWSDDFHKRLLILGITRTITPHSLRHSFITRMLSEAQVPIFDIQQIVGHSDVKTTAIYYHSSNKTLRRAINRDPLFINNMDAQQKLEVVRQHIKEIVNTFQLDKDRDLEYKLEESKESVKFEVKKKH